MITCMTCHLTAIRHAATAYANASLRPTTGVVVHAFNTSLPGWLVVIPKRHVESFAELTDDEAASFRPFLHSVSRALQEVTGAVKTYTVLFAEHPEHFHVVPRMGDMPDDKKGRRVFDYLGVPETEIVSLEARNNIAARLQTLLQERIL